ncbi:MAG: hypothetical protein ACOC5T_05380, partial [Elusimicrobiota bacterium]
ALGRSIFLIDVRFENKFERGYFRFFSFNQKKKLYVHGKRNFDYTVTKPSFIGRFPKLYTVDEKEYRKAKYEDLKEDRGTEDLVSKGVLKKIKVMIFQEIVKRLKDEGIEFSVKDLGIGFGIAKSTAYDWLGYDTKSESEVHVINNKPILLDVTDDDQLEKWNGEINEG